MNFYFYAALALSVFIAAIIAVIRFKRIDRTFYPFVFFIWVGSLNELLSIILILNKYHSTVNNNIYVLIEAILLLWFFKSLGLYNGKKYLFQLLLTFIVLVWLGENLLIGKITNNSTYFRIFYSLLIVFQSIYVLNSMIFSTRKHLLKDALFLILISFVVYFSCKALIQAFVIYGINRSSSFLINIYIIMIYVNFTINLIYALATLWIPRKNRFIKPLLLA